MGRGAAAGLIAIETGAALNLSGPDSLVPLDT